MQQIHTLADSPSAQINLTEVDCQCLLRLSTENWLAKELLSNMQQDIAALNKLAFNIVGEPMLFKTSLLNKDFRDFVAAMQSLERNKADIMQSMQPLMPI